VQTFSESFDRQAPTFEKRAGLSEEVSSQIAQAALQIAEISADDLVLEIGAGTGEIGFHLVSPAHHYIGFDVSNGMLEEFRKKIGTTRNAQLVCADANQTWPIQEPGVRLIFGSRVFHLLNIDHVYAETKRVASPKGVTLLMGKVKRDDKAVKHLMREKMREFLEDEKLVARPADKIRNNLISNCNQLGATPIEPKIAARWTVTHRPIESINSWQKKDSMGGIFPPQKTKEKILRQLREWGEKEYGDLEKEITSTETYLLEGFRLK